MTRQPFSPQDFRHAMGHYPSGINIVTSCVEGRPLGFTCQSFFSQSLEPPLIAISVMSSSSSWPAIRTAGQFAVNILSADQIDLSRKFSQNATDRWAGTAWTETDFGNPALAGALLCVDCSILAEHEVGDHWLVIGAVKGLTMPGADGDKEPLLFFRQSYVKLVPA